MDKQLAAADIILVWERGIGRSPLDRALLMLWQAGVGGDAVADLPIAERDRQLLALRVVTFGGRMPALCDCPQCGSGQELTLDPADLIQALASPGPEEISASGCTATLRDPTSRDLAALAGVADDALMPALRARLASSECTELPPELADAIDERLDARAVAAELVFGLRCGDCGAAWSEALDIAAYLWLEIETAARRIMAEVADLAAAFGWSESAILAMSEPRRQAYLSLARMR